MYSRARGLQSSVARRRKRQRLKLIALLSTFIFFIVLGGILYGARTAHLRIERTYVSGTILLSPDDIMATARESLQGSYWYVFPKNNILLYPRKGLEETLRDTYPEIESVRVALRDFNAITITLKERAEEALWCARPEEGESCFMLDGRGYVFRKAEVVEEGTLRFYGELSGEPIGQAILTEEAYRDIFTFIKALSEAGISVVSVALKEGGVREGTLQEGGVVIWNADQDRESAIENLKLLLHSSEFKGRNKEGVLSVEYIDIQNANKIFYKAR